MRLRHLAFGLQGPRRVLLLTLALLVVTLSTGTMATDERVAPKPNYDLAARWMASKVGKLVFDTTVSPRWAEGSDRFWYAFETAQGRQFVLVDPVKRTKTPLWDNAKMAAMLTGITRIPYDSQHLPIQPTTMKWVKNDTAIRFEVEVPKEATIVGEKPPADDKKAAEAKKDVKADEQKKEEVKKEDVKTDEAKKDEPKEEPKTTKTLYFEYDLATSKIALLPDFKADPKKPGWAQVSPDGKTVLFARGFNLFMMDAENYKLAQKDFGDPKIQEVQLTTDGEDHYSFARQLTDEAKTTLKKDQKGDTKHKDGPRVPAIGAVWSKDSSRFAMVRTDQRKVADLWVINSLAQPRPTLETYRYAMPGEEHVDQQELIVFDRASKQRVTANADAFKDQSLQIATGVTTA